jgi:hypothetical protein
MWDCCASVVELVKVRYLSGRSQVLVRSINFSINTPKMGRVTDKGISGLVGSVVFYTVKGKNFVKGKPEKRKKKRE